MTDPAIPKHRVIFETLHRDIAAGRYDGTRRIPSETELCRRFATSRPTVARALRDLQNLGFLERRVGSGTYLRKSPPTQSRLFGLLVSGLGNTEILDPICTEIARVAEANEHAVLWGDLSPSGTTAGQAEALCRQYIERKVAGVFFAPLELPEDREAVNQRIVDALYAAGVPVVLLDRDLLDFPNRSRLDLIGIDNFTGAFVLADHLIGLGCRRIRFIAKPRYPATTDLRIAGCREALARRGLVPEKDWVRIGDPADANFVQKALKPGKCDAIICSNDLTAALLIRTLNSIGLTVPSDLRVVGFDDVRYATLLPVPLTTMRQPCREIGRVAVKAMLERIADPALPGREILLRAELIIRQSCGGG